MTNKTRYILLFATIILIVGAIIYLESSRLDIAKIREQAEITPNLQSTDLEEKKSKYPVAKEIVKPAGYLNTDSVKISDLIGEKVILVDFMTYSCINCQRTFPYLNTWHEKYKDQGLQIIGIHTPEFEFEKDYENVKDALGRYGITYPVVLDNDYGTWSAYGNRYWPHKYLIDIDGFIVYDHAGEGAYDEAEKKIQELLMERREKLNLEHDIATEISKPEKVESITAGMIVSPEIYFGSLRNKYLGNGKIGVSGVQKLEDPDEIKPNTLYLVGEWDIQDEYAENKNAGAKIIFRYQGQKVFIVASAKEDVKLELAREGDKLKDVDVKEEMLYRLVEDPEGYGQYTLEITVTDPGFRAYAFTFG
jgi:thiol-disulfide isomerase/thioredoxin